MTDTLNSSGIVQRSASSLSLSQSFSSSRGGAGGDRGSQQNLSTSDDAGIVFESHSGDSGDPLLRSMLTSTAVAEAMSESVVDTSKGFLQLLTPQLSAVTFQLSELQSSQEMLLASIHEEIEIFKALPELQTITDTLAQVPTYQQKLINMRREMLAFHDKMSRLKKRAARLKEKREEDEAKEQLHRQKEMEKEKQLMAKPAESLVATTTAQTQAFVDDTPAATIAIPAATSTSTSTTKHKEKTKHIVSL